jgi:hypothetical protein
MLSPVAYRLVATDLAARHALMNYLVSAFQAETSVQRHRWRPFWIRR